MVRERTHHQFLVGAAVQLRLPIERKIYNNFNVSYRRGESRTERLSTYRSIIFLLSAVVATHTILHEFIPLKGNRSTRSALVGPCALSFIGQLVKNSLTIQ